MQQTNENELKISTIWFRLISCRIPVSEMAGGLLFRWTPAGEWSWINNINRWWELYCCFDFNIFARLKCKFRFVQFRVSRCSSLLFPYAARVGKRRRFDPQTFLFHNKGRSHLGLLTKEVETSVYACAVRSVAILKVSWLSWLKQKGSNGLARHMNKEKTVIEDMENERCSFGFSSPCAPSALRIQRSPTRVSMGWLLC